jgi:hypothetical protein
MAKVLNFLFQSTILEIAHLAFHKQSLDLLKLYMLPQIKSYEAITPTSLPYNDTVCEGLNKHLPIK